MNTPLLSICIPTYNREPYLKRLVKCLLEQLTAINEIEHVVELVILDNGSEDNTEGFCNELIYSYPSWLRYHRHEKNIGMDGNFECSFNYAKGKYFWMIGDDDLVRNNGVNAVVKFLSENPSASLINLTSCFIGDKDKRQKLSIQSVDSIVNYKVHSTVSDFISDVGIFITFISGIIVNKNNILISPEVSEQCKGDSLYQLSWVFTALKEKKGLFISVKEPIIVAEPDNSGGYNLFKVFCIGFIRIASYFFLDRKMIVKLKRISLYFVIRFVFKPELTRNFINNGVMEILDSSYNELLEYRYFIRYLIRLKLNG